MNATQDDWQTAAAINACRLLLEANRLLDAGEVADLEPAIRAARAALGDVRASGGVQQPA